MSYETNTLAGSSSEAGETNQQLAMLRESANRFCLAGSHLKRARQLRGTSPGFDRQVWQQMAELGWFGILVPQRFGGLELTCLEMAAVSEALGRSLFPEPVVAATVLGGGAILHGENDDLKAELLPALVKGYMIPALAWREADYQGDILTVNTRAEPTSSGVTISGVKRLIVGGAGADGFVVSARSVRGIGLYWIPADAVKQGLSPIELADGRAAADLTLAGIKVPHHHRIAGPGSAEAVLTRVYDEALIVTAAELLGVLTRSFEITLDYLRTRVQFGKLIGSYQGLQHRAVDLYAAEIMCRYALDEVLASVSMAQVEPKVRSALASRVKARCSEASLRVTREAIQMHGAIGFSDECDIGLFLKRAITLSGWLGGAEFHRRRFARLAGHEQADD